MRVLEVAATREIDRRATEEFGIPSLLLMENAALGVVEALGEGFPEADRVLILCGPGNNGGDGLAVARHLDARGFDVEVWLVGESDLRGDAAVQQQICARQGVASRRVTVQDDLPAGPHEWDVVVDALFGIGLTRPLAGIHASVVDWLAGQSTPCLAVDLPSGLSGDSASVIGPHVRADATVTFETPKPAHVLPPACDAVGEVIVADLGVPPALVAEASGDLVLATPELAASWLGLRSRGGHKGDFGHVLVVAGSQGMGGAAVLAARGALRGGAGLVTAAVPESVLAAVAGASLESMTLALPETVEGLLSPTAVEPLLAAAETRDVLALGPGLGAGETVEEIVLEIVSNTRVPLVIDASALTPLAGRLEVLRSRRAPVILTPHAGELGRLLGVDAAEITADRLSFVRRAVEETGSVVLLKGQATLTADGEGVTINSTGNPGLATGGTGDVLTGLIAALWAGCQRSPTAAARQAAALGAFVHGGAGDLAAEAMGETALTAGDLLPRLPEVLRGLETS